MASDHGIIQIIYDKDEIKSLQYPINQVEQYLQKLGSCGLGQLVKEPERISEEKSTITSQSQELAFHNYPTFIETAQCTGEILTDFQNVNCGLEKLGCNLRSLREKCSNFSQTAQSTSTARRLTSLTLSRHTQLLEILELPQLMETCVRNSHWQEALELAAYVTRLERKLSYIPIIQNISQEVQSCSKLMTIQLIAQLRMPAQLPHCLSIVGYLRQMRVFSDEELRLKFLQARDAWFKSTLESIPKEDAYQHVSKTIELSRVHLFDIATQYRAIFNDEDPLVIANQDCNINDSAIFHSWLIEKVSDFLSTLKADLPRVAASSLESVFGQCMYFGLSFGRIGSDFRALLVPLFSEAVFQRFEQSVTKSQLQFSDSMGNFILARNSSSHHQQSSTAIASSQDQIQPPYALLRFPPLAELCNAIITSLNELRFCASVQLTDAVAAKLQLALQNCCTTIASFHLHEKDVMTGSEADEFAKFLHMFSVDLLDHVDRLLQIMFPSSLISLHCGFTVNEINKQAFNVLNRIVILEPMAHLLPRQSSPEPAVQSVSVEDIPPARIPQAEAIPASLGTIETVSGDTGVVEHLPEAGRNVVEAAADAMEASIESPETLSVAESVPAEMMPEGDTINGSFDGAAVFVAESAIPEILGSSADATEVTGLIPEADSTRRLSESVSAAIETTELTAEVITDTVGGGLDPAVETLIESLSGDLPVAQPVPAAIETDNESSEEVIAAVELITEAAQNIAEIEAGLDADKTQELNIFTDPQPVDDNTEPASEVVEVAASIFDSQPIRVPIEATNEPTIKEIEQSSSLELGTETNLAEDANLTSQTSPVLAEIAGAATEGAAGAVKESSPPESAHHSPACPDPKSYL